MDKAPGLQEMRSIARVVSEQLAARCGEIINKEHEAWAVSIDKGITTAAKEGRFYYNCALGYSVPAQSLLAFLQTRYMHFYPTLAYDGKMYDITFRWCEAT